MYLYAMTAPPIPGRHDAAVRSRVSYAEKSALGDQGGAGAKLRESASERLTALVAHRQTQPSSPPLQPCFLCRTTRRWRRAPSTYPGHSASRETSFKALKAAAALSNVMTAETARLCVATSRAGALVVLRRWHMEGAEPRPDTPRGAGAGGGAFALP